MPPRGLYAITSEALVRAPERLLPALKAALDGGAVLLQYRDKWNRPEQKEANARAALALCRTHGVPLLINDDVMLAARIGADGVHLGTSDLPALDARHVLGRQAIIGITCGNDVGRALAAVGDSADYVGFGAFYPSRTKPEAAPAEADTLRRARLLLGPRVRLCAIGGITPANAAVLVAAGADYLAAVGGVFDAPDIRAAAQAYSARFA